MGKKLYIISGEASGDLHGSNVMKELYAEQPDLDIRFWGGDKMQAVGGTMAKHIRELAFMGFVEVLPRRKGRTTSFLSIIRDSTCG